MKYISIFTLAILSLFFLYSFKASANPVVTVTGNTYNYSDSSSPMWYSGPNDQPTSFTFSNNLINSSVVNNGDGYLLATGDTQSTDRNNYLDGEVITGNKFNWTVANNSSLHYLIEGTLIGYLKNAIVKYNYYNNVPMSIAIKTDGSSTMTDTSGAIAYNIFNNPTLTAMAIKTNGIKVYNNTFYSSQIPYTSDGNGGYIGAWRGLIDIYQNPGYTNTGQGAQIFNNIFYTKHQIYNIEVEEPEDLNGFASDYNVFYCQDGPPLFVLGSTVNGNKTWTTYTFAQWQALGYDTHSVVINPNFKDFTSFVPTTPLNYGTNLGPTLQAGLASNATWVAGQSPATTNQGSVWQVGAIVSPSSAKVFGTVGSGPVAITVDSADNVYTANYYSNNITKVTPSGVSTTISNVSSGLPFVITSDLSNNIYYSTTTGNLVKITPSGTASILASLGFVTYSMVSDSSGNIYVANYNGNSVTRVTPQGGVSVLGTTDTQPRGIVLDSSNNVYTVNYNGNSVTKITQGGLSTKFAYTPAPYDIAIDKSGNLYVANYNSNSVSKISTSGSSSTIGTTGVGPDAITIDANGNIYTSNQDSTVSKITPVGAISSYSTLGSAYGIAVDSKNNSYVISHDTNLNVNGSGQVFQILNGS